MYKVSVDGQEGSAKLQTNLCAGYPEESRSTEIMTVAIALPLITFPIVGLRCFARWKTTGRLWWDDWMVVTAAILLAGLAGIEIASAVLGLGTHYWNVDLASNDRKLMQLLYAAHMLYILTQIFAKISILLFLSLIFSARWFQLTVRCFIPFLLLHGLVFVLATAFQCNPIASAWDKNNPNRTCLDTNIVWYCGAGVSLAEEVVILFLPIPELAKLQIDIRKKVALSFMFSLGSFACITTMIRLKYLVAFSTTFDTTWDNVDVAIWSIVKEFCAIVCASFLPLRPLLQRSPDLFSSSEKSMKDTSLGQSRRSILHIGKDKLHEPPETPLTDDLPLTPIDIADQMAAKADGKRQVLFTRKEAMVVRSESELQDVGSGMK
ncbi:integral membrane protein [Colletotrichum eremochloae]|nr:integral membrane protein [Colletotrichum eremochloae]